MPARLRSIPIRPKTTPAKRERVPVPSWLSKGAKKIYREVYRQLLEDNSWHPTFSDTLATYAVLQDEFQADPSAFTAAKLTQKRLLAADLGMSPASYGRRPTVMRNQGSDDWSDFD